MEGRRGKKYLAFLGKEGKDSWAMAIMLEKLSCRKKGENAGFGGKRKWVRPKGKSKWVFVAGFFSCDIINKTESNVA